MPAPRSQCAITRTLLLHIVVAHCNAALFSRFVWNTQTHCSRTMGCWDINLLSESLTKRVRSRTSGLNVTLSYLSIQKRLQGLSSRKDIRKGVFGGVMECTYKQVHVYLYVYFVLEYVPDTYLVRKYVTLEWEVYVLYTLDTQID